MFAWLEDDARVVRAFTDRRDGHSRSEHAGLNLGSRVADDPAAVAHNRAAVAAALGLSAGNLLFLHQVHGAEVVTVTEPWLRADEPEADAMVSTVPGLALVVLAADCVPVLLADAGAGVIGAAHVGRPGLLAGTVPAVVERMRSLGARDLDAAVGPAVCGACYEVPQQMHDDAIARVPEARAVSATGTPALDIATGVLAQLAAAGVTARQVLGCTRESEDLYSYRRDGVTGRHAGIVLLRPPDSTAHHSP